MGVHQNSFVHRPIIDLSHTTTNNSRQPTLLIARPRSGSLIVNLPVRMRYMLCHGREFITSVTAVRVSSTSSRVKVSSINLGSYK